MIDRKDIEELVSLYGLLFVEERLGVVVIGIRSHVFDKNIIVEIGEDKGENHE